jgi:hypothetical protein
MDHAVFDKLMTQIEAGLRPSASLLPQIHAAAAFLQQAEWPSSTPRFFVEDYPALLDLHQLAGLLDEHFRERVRAILGNEIALAGVMRLVSNATVENQTPAEVRDIAKVTVNRLDIITSHTASVIGRAQLLVGRVDLAMICAGEAHEHAMRDLIAETIACFDNPSTSPSAIKRAKGYHERLRLGDHAPTPIDISKHPDQEIERLIKLANVAETPERSRIIREAYAMTMPLEGVNPVLATFRLANIDPSLWSIALPSLLACVSLLDERDRYYILGKSTNLFIPIPLIELFLPIPNWLSRTLIPEILACQVRSGHITADDALAAYEELHLVPEARYFTAFADVIPMKRDSFLLKALQLTNDKDLSYLASSVRFDGEAHSEYVKRLSDALDRLEAHLRCRALRVLTDIDTENRSHWLDRWERIAELLDSESRLAALFANAEVNVEKRAALVDRISVGASLFGSDELFPLFAEIAKLQPTDAFMRETFGILERFPDGAKASERTAAEICINNAKIDTDNRKELVSKALEFTREIDHQCDPNGTGIVLPHIVSLNPSTCDSVLEEWLGYDESTYNDAKLLIAIATLLPDSEKRQALLDQATSLLQQTDGFELADLALDLLSLGQANRSQLLAMARSGFDADLLVRLAREEPSQSDRIIAELRSPISPLHAGSTEPDYFKRKRLLSLAEISAVDRDQALQDALANCSGNSFHDRFSVLCRMSEGDPSEERFASIMSEIERVHHSHPSWYLISLLGVFPQQRERLLTEILVLLKTPDPEILNLVSAEKPEVFDILIRRLRASAAKFKPVNDSDVVGQL